MRNLIVVAGALAQKPRRGGHAWVFLQYLLGFRRLGWDVLFVDRLDSSSARDAAGRGCPVGESVNLQYLAQVMEQFGLADCWTLIETDEQRHFGLSRTAVKERVSRAAFLLNVMGYLDDDELLASAGRRVFLDIDPGYGQMWRALGLHDPFKGHDNFVTIGENIGRPDCLVPTCGLDWLTTPQPVVLEHWPMQAAPSGVDFTSIASWRGAYGPVEYQGRSFGLRVHEFRQFAELPRKTGRSFRLALAIDPADTKDSALLTENGWNLDDPLVVAGEPAAYRRFVQDSFAEFLVAKNMYVQSQCGWISDRSLCYLASGRPVVAQDTGLGDRYPRDRGLLTFTTLDEAAAAVEAVSADYALHSRAARALAEERFDSDLVLSRLLAKLGVG